MLSSRFWSLLALTALVGCASGKVGTIAAPSDDSGAAQPGSDDGGDDGGTDVSSGSGTDGGGGDDGGDEGGDDGGDEGGDDGGDAGGDDGGSESDPLDTRPAGGVDYAASTESVDIDSDCEMDVTVLTPDAPPVGVVVVSHGFIRSGDKVLGWAEHYASWGFLVVVPELCHLSARDTDHEANGQELARLVDILDLGDAAFVGHSAGGLASALAVSLDAGSLGGVGLDPVDASNLGATAPAGAPFYGLFGEPSRCNSDNNGVMMVTAEALAVSEAGHCDFESPKDSVCDLACREDNPTFSDDDLQVTIRALSTAALFGLVGDTATADAWWSPGGTFYDALAADGAISGI